MGNNSKIYNRMKVLGYKDIMELDQGIVCCKNDIDIVLKCKKSMDYETTCGVFDTIKYYRYINDATWDKLEVVVFDKDPTGLCDECYGFSKNGLNSGIYLNDENNNFVLFSHDMNRYFATIGKNGEYEYKYEMRNPFLPHMITTRKRNKIACMVYESNYKNTQNRKELTILLITGVDFGKQTDVKVYLLFTLNGNIYIEDYPEFELTKKQSRDILSGIESDIKLDRVSLSIYGYSVINGMWIRNLYRTGKSMDITMNKISEMQYTAR